MRAYPKTVPLVRFSRKKYHGKFGRLVIASAATRSHGSASAVPTPGLPSVRRPAGGSPYKVSHSSQKEILTVLFRRAIKTADFVWKLVEFVDAAGSTRGHS
jgi:hypothetical protein